MVHLTHASLQEIATRVSADILHIKGPTDAPLRTRRHDSTDADILVRPAHMDRFLAGLEAAGWSRLTEFENGSPFGHASNYEHPAWASADVHREIPGLRADAPEVFERFWTGRQMAQIAHRECSIPAPQAQILIQVMHVARSHGVDRPETWENAGDELRAGARALAAELKGEVAFAAGLDELDAFRDTRDYALWKHWSSPEDNRLVEWAARLRSAHGLRARTRILFQATRVNRARLRMDLGHEPNRREIVFEQASRVRHALVSGLFIVVRVVRRR